MLSKLGKTLRALVRRTEPESTSAVDVINAKKPDRSERIDTNCVPALETPDLNQNEVFATQPAREEINLPRLVLKTPSKQIHDYELPTAPKESAVNQDETDISRVLDEESADSLEKIVKIDDDLTVLSLDQALNGPTWGSLPKEHLEQNYRRAAPLPKPFDSRSAPHDERLLDLAMKNHASTRLINVLQNPEHELPAETVGSYMLAPDAALQDFKQLDNSGEKTALELDDLVRKHAHNIDQKRNEAPDSIVKVVNEADCSVRLHNAITANSARLPVDTVRGYMRAPEHARQSFLKLPNLGRKSADELDQIIRNFVPTSTEGSGDHGGVPDAEDALQSALQAAEVFFSGLKYPGELFEWTPSVRLANILETERENNSTRFFDFLKTYNTTAARLLSQKNCGRKSIRELDEIVSRLTEARLVACGFRKELEPNLRRLTRGEELKRYELDEITALGKLRPEDIQAADSRSIEDLDVLEVISASVSTLEERQQDILQRRYGINTAESETLEEIATGYNVTREPIRQIEKKAKLRIATKRTVKILIAALEREEALERLFKDRKIVSEEQIGTVSKSLRAEERLAIDLAYGDLRTFLDAESVRTEAGWVQEQDLLSVSQEVGQLSGSLRQRIVSVIREQSLPVRMSAVASSIPDYPFSVIKDELSESLDARFEGDIICAAPRLPSPVRCILILREAGHAMHCDEIRARMYEVFGKDESIGQIGNTLAGLPEALIVERGIYDLYENLSLTHGDLTEIRSRTLRHLEDVGGFVSAKVLFSQMFQGETGRFGVAFGPYMLLGILQDDERFETKRGLMIGLASEDGEIEFRGLGEDVLAVLFDAGRSMTLVEISNQLEGRRDVLTTSISIGLENSPDAVSVGRGRYDLTARAIGNNERQADLILACAIALADGQKTAFALSEILSSVWGEIQTRPLLSFLSNRYTFQVDKNIVAVVELPEVVQKYIEIRNQVLKNEDTGFFDLEAVQEAARLRECADLTRLDRLFADKEEADGNEEMLGMILGDFGIN